MNTGKLESKIRNAIVEAIWDYEAECGNISNAGVEAYVNIDECGGKDIDVSVYEN